MMNPFKKLQQRRQQQASAERASEQRPSGRAPAGITISVAPVPPPMESAKDDDTSKNEQSLDTVLPPASDYLSIHPSPLRNRQSLIMPHLTRRFTLLRAPDGTLLSPDAMRAHLRAQRARARATGGANAPRDLAAHHFLTEEEENEIIDQLRLQAKAEGRSFEADDFRGSELWSSGYASGTDGFGSWGGSHHSAGSNLQSLAENLGDLDRSTSSRSLDADGSPTSPLSPGRRGESGGALFSGRSSERDMAYFRTVDKERKEHRLEAVSEAVEPDGEGEEEEESRPLPDSDEQNGGPLLGNEALSSSAAAAAGDLAGEAQAEVDEASSAEGAMPGDFMAAERRGSKQHFDALEPPRPSDDVDTPKTASFLAVPSSLSRADSDSSSGARQSRLLNSLSPEAFKRVSTALEEVFGIMAAEGSIKSAASTPVGGHFDLDRPSSQQSRTRSADSPAGNISPPADSQPRSPAAEEGVQGRESVDSDGVSFTSAFSGHGNNGSPSFSLRDAPRQQAGAGEESQPSFELLNDVHIEGRGLGIGQLDLGRTSMAVPASDSNTTIMAQDGREAQRDSMLTAGGDRSSTVEDTTPVLSPAEASRFGPEAVQANGLSFTSVPIPHRHLEEGNETTPASSERDQQEAGHSDVASTLGAPIALAAAGGANGGEGHGDGDATVTSSTDPPADSSPSYGIGTAMTSFGEAWSPRGGAHSRNTSIASGHSRNDSSGKMGSDKGSNRVLNEQGSLSSVRRHYRQHSRSATASSEHFSLSPRSSRAMSPVPVLSRTARSPNYFPPPSSGASMQSYAAGFKPPSAVLPAAIAAASSASPRTRTLSNNGAASPYNSWTTRTRDSAFTRESDISPYLTSAPGFSPSVGGFAGTSIETGPSSYGHQYARASAGFASAGHSRSGSNNVEASSANAGSLVRTGTVSSSTGSNAAAPSRFESSVPAANGRLLPGLTTDTVQAERWRATYNNQPSHATALTLPSDANAGVVGLGQNGQVAEEEDLWAQIDQALSGDAGSDARPVSSMPPFATEDHLANAGVTLDQLATYQHQLVQSAHDNQPPPPLPTTPASQIIPTFSTTQAPTSPQSISSPSAEGGSQSGVSSDSAGLEGAREVARMADKQRTSGLASSPGQGSIASRFADRPSGASPYRSADHGRLSSVASPASSSAHGGSRAMKSEVMYDVTTSHRPTSPPPVAARPISTGLPTLMDFSASYAGQPERQSMSLVQAIEQAGGYPKISTPDQSTWRDRESLHHGLDAIDHHSIASGGAVPESRARAAAPEAERVNDSANRSIDYAQAITFDSAAGSSQDLDNHPYGHIGIGKSNNGNGNGAGVDGGESLGIPRSASHNVLEGNSSSNTNSQLLRSPASPQTVWSEPGGEHQNDEGYLRPDRMQLIDDVAAQARAATEALKGIDNGSAPTPPFRTKSIARRKSFRKVSKQISSPQLISTTQKMDHVVQIAGSDSSTRRTDSIKSSQPYRTPIWNILSSTGGNDAASIPEVPLPGKGRRPSGTGHRRRSSSFGHSVQGDGSDFLHQQRPPPDVAFTDASPAASPAASPRPDRATHGPGQQHPSISKSASSSGAGGGLSRFMSKMRSRKTSEVTATIEPFPQSPSNSSSFGHTKSSPAHQNMSPTQPSRSPSAWRSPEPRSDSLRSPSLCSKQSFLSPASSSHPLPRIDSTSMLSRGGKKYRTPIVLKRESEVFLPGDLELESSKPFRQSFGEVASTTPVVAQTETVDITRTPEASSFPAELPSKEMPSSFSASSMPIQDRWEADTVAAAAFADGNADSKEESKAPETPMPAASLIAPASPPELQPAPSLDVAGLMSANTRSSVASGSRTSPAAETETKRKADQRKSLRDTVVRRTIIIPTDFDFEDRRKSTMSTASRRKSKKPAPFLPDEMPWNASMATSTSSLGGPRPDDSVASKDAATSCGSVLPQRDIARTSTPPVNAGPLEDAMDSRGLPTLPSSSSTGLSTLNSQQSLMPTSASAGFGRGSEWLSNPNNSYAGSLYDMYIGGDDGSDGNGLSEDGRFRSSRLPLGGCGAGDRTSKMPEGRRHIEVTERADGSVVWQVLAGLADRGSVYSDYESRHSIGSNGNLARGDRDSLMMPNFNNRDSMLSETYDLEAIKTPAGLTNEDSRSFFAKPRGHRKSFSFDATQAPPMPGLPPNLRRESTIDDDAGDDTSTQRAARTGSQAVFEMATSPSQLENDEAISPTRIVYHNDAQLASLLDLLARGKDSAKFEFQAMGYGHGSSAASRPVSTWTKTEGSETLDADDIESHRNRVEAEIYTLLNQQTGGATSQRQ